MGWESVVPIVSGVLGVAQNQQNMASQQVANMQNNYQNMAMQERAFEMNKEMWNTANEYNTPAAQMQRFTEAGLNPHLIYGQGNSGNAAQSMPQYQAPRADYQPIISNLPNLLAMYNDTRLKDAQIDSINQNTENAKIDAGIKGIISQLKGVDLKYADDLGKYSVQGKQMQIKQGAQQIRQSLKQMGLTDLQTQWAQEKLDWLRNSGYNIDQSPSLTGVLAKWLIGMLTGQVKTPGKINKPNRLEEDEILRNIPAQ